MVRLDQIRKRYGEHTALNPLDLSIPDGQTIGLLGPNGAGKSTLMNIITGCLPPSGGSVTIGSWDLMKDPRPTKRLIGYLPEQAPLYDEMTVRDYLAFVCRLREVDRRSVASHIDEIAEMVRIGDILRRRIGNLSKGLRQRVGLAQSLCGDPQILILDEPTAGLDPIQSAEFQRIISSFAGEKTVLFSSHLLSEVQALCSRVIILDHGTLISDTDLRDESAHRTLRATVAMEKGALLPALRSLDVFDKVRAVPEEEEGLTTVILTCSEDSPVPEKALFTLLSGLKAPLIRLSPVEESLEDTFLRITDTHRRRERTA